MGDEPGLRAAILEEDLSWILSTERAAIEGGYIRGDDECGHRRRFADESCAYLIAERAGARLGYAVLAGLGSPDRNIELMRIVMAAPGRGEGQRFIRAIFAHVFEECGANRLWLDTLHDNTRAQHIYENFGFTLEGRLREAFWTGEAFEDLLLYSLLARDYAAQGE